VPGIFAPGKTPPAIINKLNAELNKALAEPDVRDRCCAAARCPRVDRRHSSARPFAPSRRRTRIVKEAGIKID
jgi:tripartite-type tricarboxylate transporter receptor subunit TctC